MHPKRSIDLIVFIIKIEPDIQIVITHMNLLWMIMWTDINVMFRTSAFFKFSCNFVSIT
ncbi:hypothetical protein ACJX0J_025806, partial [Zea mays]